jgi:hypothetical protein
MVRTEFFSKQIKDFIELNQNRIHPDVTISKLDSRLINVGYQSFSGELYLSYKVPFGFFFLISISLLVLKARYQEIKALIVIHLVVLIICSVLIRMSLTEVPQFLFIIDLLTVYLIPLCSLGLVALAYIQKKNERTE